MVVVVVVAVVTPPHILEDLNQHSLPTAMKSHGYFFFVVVLEVSFFMDIFQSAFHHLHLQLQAFPSVRTSHSVAMMTTQSEISGMVCQVLPSSLQSA